MLQKNLIKKRLDTVLIISTDQEPYVCTQLAIATVRKKMPASAKASKTKGPKTGTIERATLERNAINPRIKRRKLKPLEIMNAKARRAELSRMIDGTSYSC